MSQLSVASGLTSGLAAGPLMSTVSLCSASASENNKLEVSVNLNDTKFSSGCLSVAARACSDTALSAVEAAILRSSVPIDIDETEQITVLGQSGIWANRCEVINWNGPIPITEYSLNEDFEPEVIHKKVNQNLEYIQELAVRYLKPSTPPPPGDIIITQEPNIFTPPAPPVIIRQQPPRPCTPKPMVIREIPPKQPPLVGRKLITISGKQLPPPPRKVVIERLPPIPSKPQPLIVERWLPYGSSAKRRVIFQTAPPDPVVVRPKNVLVQWGAPEVSIRQEIKYLGVVKANPIEYAERYGDSLKSSDQLPEIVTQIQNPCGIVLAADQPNYELPELEGEIEALKLIDMEAEGLAEYKTLVYSINQEKSECSESFKSQSVEFSSASASAPTSTAVNTPCEMNNTTIVVNSSPVSSPVNTSLLPSLSSLPEVAVISSAANLTSAAAQPTSPTFDASSAGKPEIQSSVSLALAKDSIVASSLHLETSLFNQSLAYALESSAASASPSYMPLQQPVQTVESDNYTGGVDSLAIDASLDQNTSLFSNLSTLTQQQQQKQMQLQSVAENNVAPDITFVTPSSPVSSVLSSRMSLKSTSIALISGSASATSVSTYPTNLNNSNVMSNYLPSASSSAYQSFDLKGSLSNEFQSTANNQSFNFILKTEQFPIMDQPLPSAKLATPSALIKTPAPTTAITNQATSTSTLQSISPANTVVARSTNSSPKSEASSRSRRSVADSVIERLFALIDINGDGAVSIEEAERIFLKLNSRLGRNYGSDDVKMFFQNLDPSGTGKINMEQFKKAFPNRI